MLAVNIIDIITLDKFMFDVQERSHTTPYLRVNTLKQPTTTQIYANRYKLQLLAEKIAEPHTTNRTFNNKYTCFNEAARQIRQFYANNSRQ